VEGYPRVAVVINALKATQVDLISSAPCSLHLHGKTFEGKKLETDEDIRVLLLERGGVAVVPFRAFGVRNDTGWFRLSVGAVSMEEIGELFPPVRSLLDQVA
jgi:aspartate aminotransferase